MLPGHIAGHYTKEVWMVGYIYRRVLPCPWSSKFVGEEALTEESTDHIARPGWGGRCRHLFRDGDTCDDTTMAMTACGALTFVFSYFFSFGGTHRLDLSRQQLLAAMLCVHMYARTLNT